MPRWVEKISGRVEVVRSLVRFLWTQRLWWLIPFVGVLLLAGILLLIAQQTAIAPFLYTLF